MKLRHLFSLSLLCTGGILSAQAGHVVVAPSSDKKEVTPEERKSEWFPDDPAGLVTVGGLWSEHLSGVYVDSVTGIWAPQKRDAYLFLDSRYHYEDNTQFIQSTGLGFRKLFREQKIIVGVNAYYDQINSENDRDYNQAGFGAEVLTHWVDVRFNYYLPEDKENQVSHRTRTSSTSELTAGGITETYTQQGFGRFESTLEGLNLEVGFLVPGLEKYTEVRIFGGYHHYNNPFGSDFDGFQARLEARLLPGLIADLEYWDDARLMGGHWTAGLRASVPFSLFALARGHNPFAGTSDYFRPRSRDFDERLSEMVIRSHRVQTVTSGDRLLSSRTTIHTTNNTPPPPATLIPFE